MKANGLVCGLIWTRIISTFQKIESGSFVVKLSEAIRRGTITARNMAKITGSIMSMSIALGSIVRLRTCYMYGMINQRRFWNEKLELPTEARNGLEFWLGIISMADHLGGHQMQPGLCIRTQVTLVMEVTLWSLDHTCLMGSGQKKRLDIVQPGGN